MQTYRITRTYTSLALSLLLCIGTLSFAQGKDEAAGINLELLQEAGYRIDWVNQSTLHGLHLPTISSGSFYTVDNSDFISKYDLNSGEWLWSTPVGNQTYKIKSITELPTLKRTFVLCEGGVFVIESITGNYPSNSDSDNRNNAQFFPLATTANTPAVSYQDTLIYGTTSGYATWFDPSIGFTSSTYEVGSTISVRPTVAQGVRSTEGLMRHAVVTSSNDGTVVAADAKNVRQIWTIQLLDSVNAPVSFGTNSQTVNNEELPRSSVFIAGADHYLRSVDLHTGRPRWKILTPSALEDSPFVHGNALFQRVPSVGLTSFQAFPNHFSGKQNWVAEEVTGTPITTTRNGKLVCWDTNQRKIQIVEPRKGGIIATLPIPTAKNVITDSSTNGSLFIITDSDMILKLGPRR